jgi:hypothetical protein
MNGEAVKPYGSDDGPAKWEKVGTDEGKLLRSGNAPSLRRPKTGSWSFVPGNRQLITDNRFSLMPDP